MQRGPEFDLQERRARLPPPRLPWVYLLAAHAALAWAASMALLHPELLTGYFYQPRTIALVHAVTLGWISCSILGSLYFVAPIALRARLPASRRDAIACAAILIGASGLVSHFWIDRYVGMVWSAGTLVAGFALAAVGVLPPLLRGHVAVAPRLAIAFAWANLLTAAVLGTLSGLQKLGALSLPGPPLAPVWAHAHLAALGWATMMVLGVGYRLLPMLLPAALPGGPWPLLSIVTLQCGVVGLAAALLWRPSAALLPAVACAAGVGIFVASMAGRLRRLRPPPAELARPDPAIIPVGLSLLSMAVAAVLGCALLWLPPSAAGARLAAAYGATGLIAVLAQLIAGVGMRLFTLGAWMRSYGAAGFIEPPFGPHALLRRPVQWLTVLCWASGAPLLVAGMAIPAATAVRGAASLLLLGAVSAAANLAGALWRLARVTSPAAPRNRP